MIDARGHLVSARLLSQSNPRLALSAVYDAARFSLVALLRVQGLRPTSAGGHIVVERAVFAQFPKDPPRRALKPFSRLRVLRNQSQYERSEVDAEEVEHYAGQVDVLVTTVASLLPVLGVFPPER